MAYAAVSSIRGRAGGGKAIVTSIRGRAGGSGQGARAIVTSIRGRVDSELAVTAGEDMTVDPHELVTLTAQVGGQPEALVWEQTRGVPVVLNGTGATRTFVSPPTLRGATLRFVLTITRSGVAPVSSAVEVTVRAHSGLWHYTADGVLTPQRIWRQGDPTPLPLPPGPYTDPPVDAFTISGSSSAAGTGSGDRTLATWLGEDFALPATNMGFAGEYAVHAAAWSNAVPVQLTLTGNQIPASGSVVVSAHTFGTTNGNAAHVHPGTLNGVEATLTWAANVWRVNRVTPGPAIPVGTNITFVSTPGEAHRYEAQILWWGKNDLTLETGLQANTIATIAAGWNYFGGSKPTGRVLIVGLFCNGGQTAGDAGRTRVLAVNASSATAYGTRYIDVQTYLMSAQVWADTGIIPTAADTAAQTAGVLPPGLSSDPILQYGTVAGGGIQQHLNAAGYRAVSQLVADRVLTLNWYSLPALPADIADWDPATLLGQSVVEGDILDSWSPAGASLQAQSAVPSSTGAVFRRGGMNGYPAVELNGSTFLAADWPITYGMPMTIAAIFKRDSPTISGNVVSGDALGYAYLGGTGDGKIVMGAGAPTQITAAPRVEGWFIAVGVFNGAESRLYVNSITPAAIGTTGTGPTAVLSGVHIGSTATGLANFLDGMLGRLKIANGALNQAQVADLVRAWQKQYFETEPPYYPPAAAVTMVTPLQDAKVAGVVPLRVTILSSEYPAGTTPTVEFQIGHIDNPRWAAARMGSTNDWLATTPYDSMKSPGDRATARIDDAAVYIVPWINGVQRLDGMVQVVTWNFPADKDTKVPVWREALRYTDDMSGAAAFDAHVDVRYGHLGDFLDGGATNNTDGGPTLTMVTDPVRNQKFARFSIHDLHTTTDQPNDNVRRQVQTPRIIQSGDRLFFGLSLRVPAGPLFPDGAQAPLNSEISIFQNMGTNDATNTDYHRGLRLMLRAVARPLSDMKQNWLHIAYTDGHWGEPAVMFTIPMSPREIIWDVCADFEVSDNPALGGIKFWTRRSDVGGPLVPYDMFGIPGLRRAAFAGIEPGGKSRLDRQIYRGRTNSSGVRVYPGKVTFDHGALRIGQNLNEVDPANFLNVAPGSGFLMYDPLTDVTAGGNVVTNAATDIRRAVTPGTGNTIVGEA